MAQNVDCATFEWSQNRWTKAGGGAVLNVKNWRRLLTTLRRYDREHRRRVRFEWIQGKNGAHAKRVDKLAKASANGALRPRARPNIVRRRITSAPPEVGSVRPTGQTLTIRILKAQHLPQRRGLWRYAHEVTDSNSADDGGADWAESALELRPSHTYRVSMNADPHNARILELIQEIEEDLMGERSALAAIGKAATAREVAAEIARSSGTSSGLALVRRHLTALAVAGEIQRVRVGRAHGYELVERDGAQ